MSKFKVGDEVCLKSKYRTKGEVTSHREGSGVRVKWEPNGVYGSHFEHELDLLDSGLPNLGSNHKLLSNSNWTDKHYDHYLTVKLTPEDIAAGEVKVKIDPYVVNEVWGINSVEKSGAGFHCLKTLSRMANAKNSLEREWDALIGQSTRARELLNK